MQEHIVAHFWERVDKIELTGCWLWDGYINKNRYGTWSYTVNGKTRTVYAHRAAYELLRGPIPRGLVLDHLCRVRNCVNPDHLDPCTQAENLRRRKPGRDSGAFNRNKTHCPRGHEYDEVNLYVGSSGKRSCRACAREKARIVRASIPPKPRKRQKFCKRGHEFTPENVYIAPSGSGRRTCRECSREKVRKFRAKKKALQIAL